MEQDIERTAEAFPPMNKGPIEQIHEGMKVIDAAGEELGKVDVVKMGDPQAVTTAGQEFDERGGLFENLAEAVFGDEPKVPPALAAQLLRTGFIRIDGKGWIDTDRYVSADKISNVSADTVRLSVTKAELVEQT